MPATRFRFRRTADFTALRLGRAVLGYLALVTSIITMAPFRFQWTPAHGLTNIWNWSDLVMNVLMFVPFGFVYQLTRPRGAPPDWPRVVILGAALSGTIETLQLFSPTRYTSLLDLATNTAGAALGAWAFTRLARHLEDDTAVQSLALELPLMGLVYQLIPLCWLIGLGSEGGARRIFVLPVAAFAGAILGTVHAAYLAPSRNRSGYQDRRWLVALALGWVIVAVVPGARGDIDLICAGATLTVGIALLRSIATTRDLAASAHRRFELPTLRLVLPLFAAYLALSSLWPLDAVTPTWHWIIALAPAQVELTQPVVYRLLEHVAAFTLAGYVIAEFHGRDARGLREAAPRVAVWAGGISLLLEVARGWYPDTGASVLLWMFTVVAALFGGWLYLLQRDHVRALVERRRLLASLAAAKAGVARAA
ncbi:VanZ family protein [Gemmatimonas groenlandica]|uniref:VanZ family protein n=1 Tax=Gemmatimonas groenlandica TaxID=2732249 RepID=A0A6M4IQT2_9BACT|nr:VanZ family protein [Gemmatimonas groenlandica]QJR37083.1 VanZ family protein [Gemmatimonas groenlandica]